MPTQQFDPNNFDDPNPRNAQGVGQGVGHVPIAHQVDIAFVPTLLAHDSSIGVAAGKASELIMEAISQLSAPGKASSGHDRESFQVESEQIRRLLVAAVMFALLWANNNVFLARVLGKKSRLAYLLDISSLLYRVVAMLMPSGAIIHPSADDHGQQ